MLCLLFEIREVEILENQLCNFVYVDFSFVVLLTGLIAPARSLTWSLPGLAFVPDDIANLGIAVAGAYVLLFAVVKPELVFIKRANRDLNNALAVREDDRLVGDDRAQILLDRISNSLFVAILIDLTFALERPIVSLN